MYQLLVMDLDDTLLEEDLTIPQTTIHKIQELKKKGVGVTLATGRMYPSACVYAQKLHLDLPLITYNGAVVRSAFSQTPIFSDLIAPEQIRLIVDCCKRYGWYLQLYHNDAIVVEKITDNTRLDPDMAHTKTKEVGSFLSAELHPTPKMMIVAKPDELEGIKAVLSKTIGNSLCLTQSKPYLLEMMSPDVSKAKALTQLAAKLGIDRKQVVAIGDNKNDLEMIQWAGLGIAVGNATKDLKDAAAYTAQANRSRAIEEVIDRYF